MTVSSRVLWDITANITAVQVVTPNNVLVDGPNAWIVTSVKKDVAVAASCETRSQGAYPEDRSVALAGDTVRALVRRVTTVEIATSLTQTPMRDVATA